MSQTKAQLIDAVDGSIVTADLADDAVNADKLASNSVVSASIVDGSILNVDINASAAIAGSKLNPVSLSSVGIGTASPAENLHINSTSGSARIRMTSADGSDNMIVFGDQSDNATGSIKFDHSDNSLALFGFNNSERMRIDSSGNVGIGTSSPNQNLMVMDTIANQPQIRLETSDGGSKRLDLFVDSGSNAVISAQQSAQDIEINARNHTIISRGGVGSEVESMRITSTGLVGIGTTSPDQLIHINKTSGATLFKASVAGNSTIGLEIQKTGSTTQSWRIVDGQTVNGKLEFYDVTDSATRMCIDGSGNVGIGTTSPSELLQVAGTLECNNIKFLTANKFESSANVFEGKGTNGARLRSALSSATTPSFSNSDDIDTGMFLPGSDVVGLTTGGSERMRIDSAGSLLIGTTTTTGTSSSGNDIVIGSIGDSTDRGITLATSGTGTIRWADAGDNAQGRIQYSNSSDVMTLHTSNAERFRIDDTGRTGINCLEDNGGFVQMKPLHNFDNGATGIQSSGTQATLRVRTSSNSSMSLYIGGLDDSIDSARPYLQVGNRSSGGPSAFYDLYLCPFGGNVRTLTILPRADNSHDLGAGDRRWDDVFATNGTINTSDKNEKNTIVDSDLGLSFINKLKPVSYKFNGKTRTHYGLIAQDIETVLSDISKSTTDFAGFIKAEVSDVLYTEDEPLPTGKNVGDVKTPGTTNYGLRYAEFIAPLVKAVQELSVKVAALEAA